MSERKRQSDTSRVIKNPLFSGVPGLIDDFTHNSFLLPAAEYPPGTQHLSGDSSKTGKLMFNFYRMFCILNIFVLIQFKCLVVGVSVCVWHR